MCISDLEEGPMGHKCTNCDFFIGKSKFNDLIEKMSKSKPRRCATGDEIEKNLSELNNLEV